MGKRLAGDWLSTYMRLSAISEAPDSFHYWAGVWALASTVRRNIWIDQRLFQWIPNFYIVLVAPPGVAVKSTTIGVAESLARRNPAVVFGPPSITWQALTDALAEAQTQECAAITCAISELGTFFDPRDPKMIDVLVDLWDGRLREWQHRTRGREGAVIRNPVINLIGATTPQWIRDSFTRHMLDGGLASRCIFVFATAKERLIPYPAAVAPAENISALCEVLAADLLHIGNLRGEMRLDREAIEWGSSWYAQHWREDPPPHLASYWARKQTFIHKLAMILSVSESDDLVVRLSHLRAAERVITSLEEARREIFAIVGTTEQGDRLQRLLATIRANPGISHRELFKTFANELSTRDYAELVASAIKGGFVRMEQDGGEPRFWAVPPAR